MNGSPLATLLVSIFVMVFCCQPVGVVSTVFAAMAMGAENAGDITLANRHLSTAHTLNVIAVVLGIIFLTCLFFGMAV